jgi:hypothetical protein
MAASQQQQQQKQQHITGHGVAVSFTHQQLACCDMMGMCPSAVPQHQLTQERQLLHVYIMLFPKWAAWQHLHGTSLQDVSNTSAWLHDLADAMHCCGA